MRFLFIILLAVTLFIPPTLAQAPVPREHPVKDVENQLKSSAAREKALLKQMKNLKSDLAGKRRNMIKVAAKIKKNEQMLLDLEHRIDGKRQEQLVIEVRLNEDQGSIADLVLALERMRRVPPEALLARPGAPLETAQSAMLLQSVLPRIYGRAEGLKQDLDRLKSIIESLKQDRAAAVLTAKQLEKNHSKLSSLLSERENLYSQTAEDVKKQQKQLQAISLQARNLKDLVGRIERRQRDEDARRKQGSSSKSVGGVRTPIPKAGQAQLPISGIINVGYGKADDIGAVSEGLKIGGRAGALVVAPMGGVVDYAGSFKGYGQIIILKHQKGYHSLIAGLGKIDTVVGRAVSAGEPIGKMGQNSSDQAAPTLYYELRYKGHPVNPSKKISGLK